MSLRLSQNLPQADAYAILTPLASTLTTLGLTNDGVIAKTLNHMGWSGTGFNPPSTADETFGSKGLELIAVRVRQIAEESVRVAAATQSAVAGQSYSTLTPGSSPAYSTASGSSPAYPPSAGSSPYSTGASPAYSYGSSSGGGGESPVYGRTMTPSPSPTFVTDEFVFDPGAMPQSLVPIPRGISPERAVPDAAAQAIEYPLELDLNFESVWSSTLGAQPPQAKYAAVQSLQQTKPILEALQSQQFSAAQQDEIGVLEDYLQQDAARMATTGGAGVGAAAAAAAGEGQHKTHRRTESDDLASLLALDIDSLAAPWGGSDDQRYARPWRHDARRLRVPAQHGGRKPAGADHLADVCR